MSARGTASAPKSGMKRRAQFLRRVVRAVVAVKERQPAPDAGRVVLGMDVDKRAVEVKQEGGRGRAGVLFRGVGMSKVGFVHFSLRKRT